MTNPTPDPNDCLAYAVLKEPDKWLGLASPTGLSVFLAGVELRAATTKPDFPAWRIYGPLEDPDFYEPLVARTRHPTLTIKWAGALELLHFSMSEAFTELRHLVTDRFHRGGVPLTPVGKFPLEAADVEAADMFWKLLARRPGMYLGGGTGWHLSWYLAGLTDGGDWLRLPEFPKAREISLRISKQSEECYGSKFGGYRVYGHLDGVKSLLAWAGIEPMEDSPTQRDAPHPNPR